MPSIVSICNVALSHLGKDDIASLTEKGAEARACNRFWKPALDALLAAHPWRFAKSSVSMAEVSNTKPGDWAHAYKRPAGCLSVRHVRHESVSGGPSLASIEEGMPFGYPYEIEGDVIFCDLSPAVLVYTVSISDPERFPPLFVEALSWHLAWRMAIPLTRDLKQREAAFKTAAAMQAVAAASDANEERTTSETGSDYVRSRG